MAMAERIASLSSSRCNIEIRLHVGESDKLATVRQVRRLREMLGKFHPSGDIIVYEKVGHAVWLEHARHWRKDVLTFLN